MQKTILMIVAVALVGCGKKPLIVDPIVEEAIRYSLNKPKGELTEAELEKVTVLDLYANQLTEIPKELEKLTQLKELSLSVNPLTDVKGLEKLTQLTHLKLSGNKLTSVKGLEKLTKLRGLYLGLNQLTDVKGLENLTQLKYLYLGSNNLTDVKGLEKLTKLKELLLVGNKLTDVKGLEKLAQLTFLHLQDNPDLTKAQIDELKKALPNYAIYHNAKK